jgi:hypothetical protein
MKLEFPKIFGNLFFEAKKVFNEELSLKIDTIREHEVNKVSKKTASNKVKSGITIKLLGGIQQAIRDMPISEEDDEDEDCDGSGTAKSQGS